MTFTRALVLVLSALIFPYSFGAAQHESKRPVKSIDHSEDEMFDVDPTLEAAVRLGSVSSQFPMFRVNQDTTALPQNEPHVRISRTNRDNMVAAWRDFRKGASPPFRQVGIGHTTDGGRTWTERLFVDTVASRTRQSDPSVAVDGEGNFYVCILSFDPIEFNGNALLVVKSTDGGKTFLPQVAAIENVSNVFEDRQIMWVDDDTLSPHAGNVYVSWTRFPQFEQSFILLARSTDGGQSFEPPVRISEGTSVQGSMPTSGPDGEVYVVWEWFDFESGVIRIDKSFDGGATFSTHVDVAPAPYIPGPGIFSGGISVFEYPTAAVDRTTGPRRGHVYVSWADYTANDADIWLSRSADGGGTWSTPVRVNDDSVANGKNQFFQWIAVDDSGWVNLVFFDRRNDPDSLFVDVYLAQSRDGGQTFENYRLTDTSFDPRINYNRDVRIGDYLGIDAHDGRIVPIYTTTHLGSQDVFVSVIDSLGIVTSVASSHHSQPTSFALEQNYPNPFNPVTIIPYSLPPEQLVSLKIYNILGEEVATLVDREQPGGSYRVHFSPDNLPSGIYFYRLTAGGISETRKMTLLR